MSEYEMLSLFYQMVEVANASLANFLTVIFAMLVASFLAADKVDRVSMVLALLIFTLFALGMANEVYSGYRDFAALGQELALLAGGPGSALAWHPMAGSDGTEIGMVPWLVLSMCVASYLATLWFFFHRRRAGLGGGAP